MIWDIIGLGWMAIVIWATALTLLSKKLSWLEKVVICIAIVFSFYLAAFVDMEDLREIVPFSTSEYV